MQEKDPLEELYDRVEDLLRLAQEKSGKPIDLSKVPPDFYQRLDKIKRDLSQFQNVTQNLIGLTGVTPEELEERLAGERQDLNDDNKYLLKKGDQLIKQAQELKSKIESQSKESKSESKPQKPLSPRQRKGKFKKMGSKENWKPL